MYNALNTHVVAHLKSQIMNKISVLLLLSLLSLLLIQLGAQLFAITVAVTTLIESPPESFAMIQGDFPYDSSTFWNVYPNIIGSFFLITIIFNWRTKFKKWILISFGLYVLSAIFAIFVLDPAQANVLNQSIDGTQLQDLKNDALTWYRYDWILFLLTLTTSITLIIPIFKHLNERK